MEAVVTVTVGDLVIAVVDSVLVLVAVSEVPVVDVLLLDDLVKAIILDCEIILNAVSDDSSCCVAHEGQHAGNSLLMVDVLVLPSLAVLVTVAMRVHSTFSLQFSHISQQLLSKQGTVSLQLQLIIVLLILIFAGYW